MKNFGGIAETPVVTTGVPPQYPFPAGRRCVNKIVGEKGWQTCGNPINRYSEFEICNACKSGSRGMAVQTQLSLWRQKGRRKDRK
jgi:hypothetical protein